jgi:hypothetical protein
LVMDLMIGLIGLIGVHARRVCRIRTDFQSSFLLHTYIYFVVIWRTNFRLKPQSLKGVNLRTSSPLHDRIIE